MTVQILNLRPIARSAADVEEARSVLSRAIEMHTSGKYRLHERGFNMICGMSVALQWLHGEDKAANGMRNMLSEILAGVRLRHANETPVT